MLELTDMQGLWLEGKLAMAPVWPYLYSLSKEPLGGRFAIATMPGLVRPGGTVYSWGFAAASGAKNPDGADEFIKWATSTDRLYAFGKEWLNPVPRASAIALISERRRHRRRRQGRDRGLRRLRRGRQEHDHGAAVLAAPRRARHHELGGDVARP